MKNETSIFGDADVISTYTRAEAIEDGFLVDLMQGEMLEVCKQHFSWPIACTNTVFSIMQKAVENKKHCNDYAGILHDMLHMSKVYYQRIDDSSRYFKVIITGAGRKRNYVFKMMVHAGDHGEGVVTIMMPNED